MNQGHTAWGGINKGQEVQSWLLEVLCEIGGHGIWVCCGVVVSSSGSGGVKLWWILISIRGGGQGGERIRIVRSVYNYNYYKAK